MPVHIHLLGALSLYLHIPDVGCFLGGRLAIFLISKLHLFIPSIFHEELNIALDMFSESTSAFCDALLLQSKSKVAM